VAGFGLRGNLLAPPLLWHQAKAADLRKALDPRYALRRTYDPTLARGAQYLLTRGVGLVRSSKHQSRAREGAGPPVHTGGSVSRVDGALRVCGVRLTLGAARCPLHFVHTVRYKFRRVRVLVREVADLADARGRDGLKFRVPEFQMHAAPQVGDLEH